MSLLEPQLTTIASLNTICLVPKAPKRAVALLHGFGADAQDLAPLSSLLQVYPDTAWYFPDAPLEVEIAPGFNGRAWFPLRMQDLEANVPWADQVPPGLLTSRDRVVEWLGKLPIGIENLVIGGFSQGSMVATEVALHIKKSVRGLVVLSGTLINSVEWQKCAAKRAGLPFFQSHGMWDQLLPFDQAKDLNRVLNAAGMKGDLVQFKGGHEIPNEVIFKLRAYLESQLANV